MPLESHSPITHLAVVCFASLDDVSMSVPVVDRLAHCYPDLRVTVVARTPAAVLFEYMPRNVEFRGVDFVRGQKAYGMLRRLFGELREAGVDGFVDFLTDWRGAYLNLRFRCMHVRTACAVATTLAQRRLVRHTPGAFARLPLVATRFAEALASVGLPVEPGFHSLFEETGLKALPAASDIAEKQAHEHWVGLAPFASNPGQNYPPERMEEVIAKLSSHRPGLRFFVFAAADEAKPWRERWEKRFAGLRFVTEPLGGLRGELRLMGRLDVMVSMDSVYMHMAALAGVPVVSVWGATHPFVGRVGHEFSLARTVQVDLLCRPCSLRGNRPCRRGDYACMHLIPPDAVAARVEEVLCEQVPQQA